MFLTLLITIIFIVLLILLIYVLVKKNGNKHPSPYEEFTDDNQVQYI